MFREITLHNFAIPLRSRLEQRRYTGPYRWTPSTPGKGRGFYDVAGEAGLGLRYEPANNYLHYFRLSRITGYFCDPSCDGDTLQPIVARLPHGRGFLAGWTMGEGMAAAIAADIWPDITDAAVEAHRMAERDAEDNRNAAQEE
jgi:hypothetical protein